MHYSFQGNSRLFSALSILCLLVLALSSNSAYSATLQVDATGAGGAYTTIQSAITAATAGDTIQVAAGTYSLATTISITKSLNIRGAQAGVDPRPSFGTTRVINSATESIIDANGLSIALSIEASNVTIDGFEVKNAITYLINSLGTTAFTNAVIQNNIIFNASTSGGAKGIRLIAVSGSTVQKNNIFSVADDAIEFGASTAGLSSGSTASFNEVHDLGSGGTTNSAIYAYATPQTVAINATIQGNLVYNHFGNDAIKIGAKQGQDRLLTGGSILDNVVHDTAQDGITIDTSNVTVHGNEVYNSFSSNGAIYVEYGDNTVTIENNYVHNNSAGVGSIVLGFSGRTASPTGMVVRFNSIVNNTNNFLKLRDNTGGTATVDASFNWFGSSAPATVASSVVSTAGASTTTNRVDFTPWLNIGTDSDVATAGFQPDFSDVTVAPSSTSLQTGGTGRIQEAINKAPAGGTITVINATYTEDVNVTVDATIKIQGTVTGKISGTTGDIQAQGDLSLGDGSATGVVYSGDLETGAFTVTLLDSTGATLGGNVSLAGGTLTDTNPISLSGTLSGIGNVSGAVNVLNGGKISPADINAAGQLTLGPTTFASGSTYDLDLNGTTSGTQYDTISVNGAVSAPLSILTGRVGYAVGLNDSFVVIQSTGTISGGITTQSNIFLGGYKFGVTTDNVSATKTVTLGHIKATTSTTLVSSQNPILFGQPLSFTATVTPEIGAGAIPTTNTVTFTIDQGTPNQASFDVNVNSSGVATYNASLTTGTHTIDATFNGDTNFAASNATRVTQLVFVQADLSVTNSVTPNPVGVGKNLTYTVTVANVGGSDAQTVLLSLPLSSSTNFISTTTPAGWTRTDATAPNTNGTLTFTIPTLTSNTTSSFTIVAAVFPATADHTTITATATATTASTQATPDTHPDSATATATAANFVITTATIPNATVGAPYSQTISATGGTAAYNFVITSGTLPPGLTLSSAGVLSGAATTEGTYAFTVTATDSSAGGGPFTASASYSISVDFTPVFISGPSYSPDPAIVDLPVVFSAAVQPADAILSWNFGDGSPASSEASPSHIYTTQQTFNATLTATNPRSGTATVATLAVVVGDGVALPGTIPAIVKGNLRFTPTRDRLSVTSLLRLNPQQSVQNFTVVFSFNGLLRTIVFPRRGEAKFEGGTSTLRAVRVPKFGTAFRISIAIVGQLKQSINTGVTVNSAGLPTKTVIQFTYNGQTYSQIIPLVFKKTQTTFGAKTPLVVP